MYFTLILDFGVVDSGVVSVLDVVVGLGVVVVCCVEGGRIFEYVVLQIGFLVVVEGLPKNNHNQIEIRR